jgi:hypothetical protein
MRATRRDVLGGIASGFGASALSLFTARHAVAQAVGDAVTSRLRNDLVQHAAFGDKFSGSSGDLATAEWVAKRLRSSGYQVEESEFNAPFFVPRTTRLMNSSAVVNVVPQAPVLPTGPAGITAPLALVEGESVDASVRGRIALIIAPFARHAALFPDSGIGKTVTEAARQGAVAIVIVTTGPSGEAVALNAPEQRPFVSVPVAVLAPKRAAPFVAVAKQGGTVTLMIDGDTTPQPCRNVVARVERGKRWIALSTPRSGWFGCVGERGTGTAVFLELADWLVQRFPDLSVFAMNTGGHEYFFAGSHRVVEQAPPPGDTQLWVHVGATLAARDAEQRSGRLVMLERADPFRTLMTTPAVSARAAQAFAGLSGLEKPVAVRPQAGELSTFTDRGYANAFAVLGQHSWFHTVEDTLERVDASLLKPVLQAHQRLIELVVAGV